MKTRQGFVSNSSSSSFVIFTRNLSIKQYRAIMDHKDVAGSQAWDLDVSNPKYILAETSMDNFDLEEYLKKFDIYDADGPFEYLPYKYRSDEDTDEDEYEC